MNNQYDTAIFYERSPVQRFELLQEMMVEPGSVEDWNLLQDLHYKAEKLPIGPHFYKLTLHGQTIGVLVTAVVKGMVRERNMVFPNIKPGAGETRLTNTNRYFYINRNFRVVSRFVIDTMYRGIGCGYRMMNLVSRIEGPRFMEIQSSMSKFNYFGQKAGFRFVKPMNANNHDKVLKFFRKHFVSNPQDYEALLGEVSLMSEEHQAELLEEFKEFYSANSALENTTRGGVQMEGRVARMDMRACIRGIQQIGLASPMYGVWQNPDYGRKIPKTMPLSWFDNQAPRDKLIIPEGYKWPDE